MNDRELLEAAARAAGLDVQHMALSGFNIMSGPAMGKTWNPLTDDGDALRLAVKLHLSIEHNHPSDQDEWVMAASANGMAVGLTEEVDGEISRLPCTRRAIVRAAADLAGKGTTE